MKIVNWSFITSHIWDIDHPPSVESLVEDFNSPYESLSKFIASTRKGATYLRCPAHTDFLKNTFVFTAPFDINLDIKISSTNQQIICNNISQEVFDDIIDLRFLPDCKDQVEPRPIIGIDWLNVFTSEHSLLMQAFPAFMHDNDFIRKTTVIPGEYNIGKWTRPLELVFELKSMEEKISIKKGDALAYFKFNDQDIIKITKDNTPWRDIEICNKIREAKPFRPLKERYKVYTKERNKDYNE